MSLRRGRLYKVSECQ